MAVDVALLVVGLFAVYVTIWCLAFIAVVWTAVIKWRKEVKDANGAG